MNDSFEGNTPGAIRRSYSDSGLSWWPVILYLPARLIFAFLAQALTAALFLGLGSESPWERAAAWWPVYSTITDLLCLGTLLLLARREGLRIGDLFGVSNLALRGTAAPLDSTRLARCGTGRSSCQT